MRLLLIEDDLMIGESVLDLLRAEAYATDWIRDGELADTVLKTQNYDLIVLDLGLPRLDGITVLRRLRSRGDRTPVLVTTARDALSQRVLGLDNGADDYIVKPYEADELLARIRALIRRASGRADCYYEHLGVRIFPATKEATLDGESVYLSSREWAILEILIAKPGAVLSRQQLEDKLYGWKDGISSNAVEVYVYGLRKKFGPHFIQNIPSPMVPPV